MHVSFSLIHPERVRAGERAVRREAEVFLARSGARLIEALGLVRGEDGLALGCAFRDIVLDPEMPSACWPVADVLDALAAADPDLRRRTAGLRVALGGLLVRIVAVEDEISVVAADQTAGGIRSAA
jgi:hypothetical protein